MVVFHAMRMWELSMFIKCFWIVVTCLVILTVGQVAVVAAKESTLRSRWQAVGSPGLMYFISAAWIVGGRYAQALVSFELARDSTLSKPLRATALTMSLLFIAMVVAWLVGLISLIPGVVR